MPEPREPDRIKAAREAVATSEMLVERWTHRLERGDQTPDPETLRRWIAEEETTLRAKRERLRLAMRPAGEPLG